jgi:hypothetical protein
MDAGGPTSGDVQDERATQAGLCDEIVMQTTINEVDAGDNAESGRVGSSSTVREAACEGGGNEQVRGR